MKEKFLRWKQRNQLQLEVAGTIIGAIVMAALFIAMFHLADAIAPHRMYQP